MSWQNFGRKVLIFCCLLFILVCLTWFVTYTRVGSDICCGEGNLAGLVAELRQAKQSLKQHVRYLKQNAELMQNDHNTSYVLRDLSDRLSHVYKLFSLARLNYHSSYITEYDRLEIIDNILEDIGECMKEFQQLDLHLMEKMQQAHSQTNKEKTIPWLSHTVLSDGQRWCTLHTNKAIHFHMVFFNNYNVITLRKTLQLMTAAVAYSYLDRTTKCLFILGTFGHPAVKVDSREIFELIRRVRFCKTITWKLDLEEKRNDTFQSWWKIMSVVFAETDYQGSFFQGYEGDILFIEENIVFSEDILEVASFASLIKNTLDNVWQLALAGEHGWNMVNSHPDTLIVQRTTMFLGHLYAFNMSIWREIEVLTPLSYNQDDSWSNIVGKVINEGNNHTVLVVVPTLARMSVTSSHLKYPWSLATRTIDTELMTLNIGIRDVYGFLCEPDSLIPYKGIQEIACPCSSRVWNEKRAKGMFCSTQPYHVRDTCMSGKFIRANYDKII